MSKTLLVVDDSATMRRVVEMTFAGEDVRVIGVPNGEAGLAKAKELRPDVVLADAQMTGMSGYDLCRAIKGDAGLRATPVIVMASQHSPFDEALGRDVGADDHCIKPFETQALIEKVRAASSRASMTPTTKMPAAAAPPPPVAVSPPPPPAPPPPRTPTAVTAPATFRTPSIPAPPPPPAPSPVVMMTPPPAAVSMPMTDAHKSGPKTLPLISAAAVEAERASDGAGDRAEAADRAASAALSRAGGLGLTPEQAAAVVKLTREVVERIVWEVVPDLAETIIREELRRLTR